MRALKICFVMVFFNLIIGLALPVGNPLLAASVTDTQWSLDLRDISIPETLRQLSVLTGVRIYAKKYPPENVFYKSYKNCTVGNIIRDLFKGMNYVSVWNYSERRLESIEIKFFETAGNWPPGPLFSKGGALQGTRSALTRPSYRSTSRPFTRRTAGADNPEAKETENEDSPKDLSSADKDEPKDNEAAKSSDDQKTEKENPSDAVSKNDNEERKDKEDTENLDHQNTKTVRLPDAASADDDEEEAQDEEAAAGMKDRSAS